MKADVGLVLAQAANRGDCDLGVADSTRFTPPVLLARFVLKVRTNASRVGEDRLRC